MTSPRRSPRRPSRSALIGAGALAALLGPLAAATPAAATPTAPATPSQAINRLLALWGNAGADNSAQGTDGAYRASQDFGSLATVTSKIGARAVWSQRDSSGQAITGRGVTVALLDTGVQPVTGLSGSGKVVNGPDLSLEANSSALRGQDTFGHGTYLAGIIAAHDATLSDPLSGQPLPLSASQQLGVAPDAKILAVKVATANGSNDVSQVIAGIDWVVAHRTDNGMNVRVLNLSYGTDSVQPYQVDPLADAVENAWRHGIVVVASAGNEGNSSGRLTDPAMDPFVLAVGAAGPANSTIAGWSSPVVQPFSNSGSATRSPDLVAPGASLVSLRDPGSFIDTEHPEGEVAGDSSGRLFRGSGTSQAAAVVSGAAALLLQAYPSLTPDQVKAALVNSADTLAGTPTTLQGAGELDVDGALVLARQYSLFRKAQTQSFAAATGTGSLEQARGGSHLVDPDTGAVLSGEVDVQSQPWNGASWAASDAAGSAWTGGSWNGAVYAATGWSGSTWPATAWTTARWSGLSWSSAAWDTARWSTARWSGDWDTARWSDANWDTARWSASDWS